MQFVSRIFSTTLACCRLVVIYFKEEINKYLKIQFRLSQIVYNFYFCNEIKCKNFIIPKYLLDYWSSNFSLFKRLFILFKMFLRCVPFLLFLIFLMLSAQTVIIATADITQTRFVEYNL